MDVRTILVEIQKIDALRHTMSTGDPNPELYDDIMGLLIRYKEELLGKKVV